MAEEVARFLHLPLDVILLRKLPYPPQPELAVGAVAEDGRAGGFTFHAERQSFVIEEVIKAVTELQERKYGALIVFEQSSLPQGILDSGVPVYGQVSEELLSTIFFNKTPLKVS